MVPLRPKDPAALMAFEALISVPSTENTANTTGVFLPGVETTDNVAHLTTLTDPTPGRGVQGIVEIFLSRNGTQLLRIASQKEVEYGKSLFDKEGNVNTPRVVAILIELDGEEGLNTDIFDGRVVTVVIRSNMPYTPLETLAEALTLSEHILARLPSIVNIKRNILVDLLLKQADAANSSTGQVVKLAAEAIGNLFIDGAEALTKVARFLDSNSRMPQELWNPKVRPEHFAKFLNGLGEKIYAKLEAAEAQISETDLGLGALAASSASIPYIGDLVARIDEMWANLRGFVSQSIKDLKNTLGSPQDTIDTVLGYVSGLWDGIMEAIIGFIEFAALALRLLGVFIASAQDLDRIIEVVRETTDEILQALMRINWITFWNRFYAEILPLIVELLKQKANAFIDEVTRNAAMAGYYFGYLVYTVAEFFFPPLELAKITKAIRALRSIHSASFFVKVTS